MDISFSGQTQIDEGPLSIAPLAEPIQQKQVRATTASRTNVGKKHVTGKNRRCFQVVALFFEFCMMKKIYRCEGQIVHW